MDFLSIKSIKEIKETAHGRFPVKRERKIIKTRREGRADRASH